MNGMGSPCSIYPHKTSPHRMYIDRCRQMPRLPHQVMSKLRVKKLCVCACEQIVLDKLCVSKSCVCLCKLCVSKCEYVVYE